MCSREALAIWLKSNDIEIYDEVIREVIQGAWNTAYAQGYDAATRAWQQMVDTFDTKESS